jgi:hypothetical protein
VPVQYYQVPPPSYIPDERPRVEVRSGLPRRRVFRWLFLLLQIAFIAWMADYSLSEHSKVVSDCMGDLSSLCRSVESGTIWPGRASSSPCGWPWTSSWRPRTWSGDIQARRRSYGGHRAGLPGRVILLRLVGHRSRIP